MKLLRPQPLDSRGFVVPAVILALTVLSVLAVAAVLTGSDERRAARAMRDAAEAFYAAEAGRAEVPYLVADTVLDNMLPGDSLDLGWVDLDHGGSYHALIKRLDEGGDVQHLYALRVEGRGIGTTAATSGQRLVGEVFTFSPSPVLDALLKARGKVHMEDDALLSGFDEAPQAWLDAGVCDTSTFADVPGVRIRDGDDIDIYDSADLDGFPPELQDLNINDETFQDFYGPSWDDLIALADHEIGIVEDKFNPEIRPSYNDDGSCNTDDPYNWGSNDPDDPCFDYFPVIYLKGKGIRASLANGYGQAFIITDSEFDIQASNEGGAAIGPGEFAGIVLGRGCLEINMEQTVHGGIIWDEIDALGCGDNEQGVKLKAEDSSPLLSPDVHYSSCVVARTIKSSNVGSLFGWHRVTGRPFTEMFR